MTRFTQSEINKRKRVIETMLGRGETVSAIARHLGIARQTLYQFMDKYEVKHPDKVAVKYEWRPVEET